MLNRRDFMAGAATGVGAMTVISAETVTAAEPNVSLNVVYPNREGARFDVAYYRATHIPLAMKVLKARLFDLRLKEQQAKLEQISGTKKDIAFGSQIRSYVLHPYQLVKDHRTKEQVGDVNRVLDGDIDVFIKAFLMKKASGTLSDATLDDDTE